MKRRLRMAGILGAMLAVVVPELAITTTVVVLTPAVAQAQAGGMHRRTRRRTRRRTAAVVHTADTEQAAAQQQPQQQQQQPQQQQEQSQAAPVDGQQMSVAGDLARTAAATSSTIDPGVPATVVARAPPGTAGRAAQGRGMLRYG